jgi:two-component system response regulator (stage 0 sporulation protein F)
MTNWPFSDFSRVTQYETSLLWVREREAKMKSILIIDDQPHMRQLLSGELGDIGCKVESVDDVKLVGQCFENSSPDLVILDLYLKGFDGWEVLRDIKRRHPLVPVLIVTAYDSYRNDPRASRADGYMVKSFAHLDKLKQKIADLLAFDLPTWDASAESS